MALTTLNPQESNVSSFSVMLNLDVYFFSFLKVKGVFQSKSWNTVQVICKKSKFQRLKLEYEPQRGRNMTSKAHSLGQNALPSYF